MDGITLSVIRYELGGYLPLKVQKVQQPGKKELVLSVWSPTARERLVLSLEGAEPFFGFSDERKENPSSPPGFCLGLRKRLEGGVLVGIRQQGLDRVLYLDFDGHDDFGGKKRYVLVFDMAGREQNIGLYEDDALISSIVPSDEGRFEHRSPYTPPASDRLDIREFAGPAGAVALSRALSFHEGAALSALTQTVEGVGKDLAKGILAAARLNEAGPLSDAGAVVVAGILSQIAAALLRPAEGPEVVHDHRPYDIRPAISISPKGLVLHAFPLPHLSTDSEFDAVLEAARAYRERSTRSREFDSLMAQADALHKKVLRKVQSRHEAQIGDLARSRDYDRFRVWAALIDQSGKQVRPGSTEMTVMDYYADPPRETVVPLDPKKSSRDNARAYYQAYAKQARAERVLQQSVAKLDADLTRLASAREALDLSVDVSDITAALAGIEALARREGIAVKPRAVRGPRSPEKAQSGGGGETLPAVKTIQGPHGSTFIVGGSAKQNDVLITRLRKPGDTWLHAKGVTGAHVLARPATGQALSEEALLAAARLAAIKSGAKDSAKAEVDYIDAMKVRKPRGGAPGFVTYTGQKTVMVSLE